MYVRAILLPRDETKDGWGTRLVRGPGIEKFNACKFEIGSIARYDSHSVNERGGSDQ